MDLPGATQYFKKSADQGYTKDRRGYGMMLKPGLGIPKDLVLLVNMSKKLITLIALKLGKGSN
jgi:TPR repeat protein